MLRKNGIIESYFSAAHRSFFFLDAYFYFLKWSKDRVFYKRLRTHSRIFCLLREFVVQKYRKPLCIFLRYLEISC